MIKGKDEAPKDEKLKVLSPTLKTKKRFIKFQIISDKKFDAKECSELLVEELILYLGSVEFSKGGIWFMRDLFDEKKQEGVIKVSTKMKDKTKGVLALVTRLGDSKVKIKTIITSSTLKGLKKVI